MYKIGNHTCESLNFQIQSSYASSRGGQSSLTRWCVSCISNLNPIFRGYFLWVVSQIAKNNWLLQGATPTGKKTCLLAQISVTFYMNQIHLRASFFFISNWAQGHCIHCLWEHSYLHIMKSPKLNPIDATIHITIHFFPHQYSIDNTQPTPIARTMGANLNHHTYVVVAFAIDITGSSSPMTISKWSCMKKSPNKKPRSTYSYPPWNPPYNNSQNMISKWPSMPSSHTINNTPPNSDMSTTNTRTILGPHCRWVCSCCYIPPPFHQFVSTSTTSQILMT